MRSLTFNSVYCMKSIESIGWAKDFIQFVFQYRIKHTNARRTELFYSTERKTNQQEKEKTKSIDLMLLTNIFHLLSDDYLLVVFGHIEFVGILSIGVQSKWCCLWYLTFYQFINSLLMQLIAELIYCLWFGVIV